MYPGIYILTPPYGCIYKYVGNYILMPLKSDVCKSIKSMRDYVLKSLTGTWYKCALDMSWNLSAAIYLNLLGIMKKLKGFVTVYNTQHYSLYGLCPSGFLMSRNTDVSTTIMGNISLYLVESVIQVIIWTHFSTRNPNDPNVSESGSVSALKWKGGSICSADSVRKSKPQSLDSL